MPRASSPPATHRQRTKFSPIPSKPTSRHQHSPSLILELSSDDSALSPLHSPTKSPSQQRPKNTSNNARIIPSSDVIEISSDDDDGPPSQASIVADLRKQVSKLKQENERYGKECIVLKQALARSYAELKEANASKLESADGKLVLELSKLEDTISCEICTNRLYTPYLLPGCGHTFCLSCLRDWFGMTHAQFLQTNPHWNPNAQNQNILRIRSLLRPEYLVHPQIQHEMLHIQQPQPQFTCPTCRKRVYQRPVEVYALKSLIRMSLSANEAEKAKIPPDTTVVEKRRGRLVVVDPWDGFFPRE
ncbi:hypothetical protein AGABI1DRAFT_126832 [Agaricus bisporus var. burnettii JB137-S8]|uniref:RING-type domain-containing protein n=2 Tax=Agaricus bisporus var. burnettii TaxID=192524 RepID=K5W1W6_AGABU|nr:uncharacterized protein AGABI1DRAFT_126832 [Agaricus bisporus var. burnettii JB137-S8]EKM80794.1 hypothetical protein AGABI1DRAFT_126832 [Agaricus bisporus var. burnettii JB137-S8]KAF7782408.1 hypothetical protein Agabi119p4_1784 [Agaricus bisporus var. burnettii]